MDRRLAAFLAADVVGYSRLIERDELGTVERLRADLSDLVKPAIEGRAGHVVNMAGDGLLAEFASVVNATQCAIDIQQGMKARNASRAEHERIVFRIGVNVGDVVQQDEALYGDGINVSARLEALAEPGGILVSAEVARHVEGKVSVPLAFVGERTVKNIQRPVGVWRVRLSGVEAGEARGPAGSGSSTWRRLTLPVLILVLIAGIASLFWYGSHRKHGGPQSAPGSAVQLKTPTIAVLPFENLSDDPAQSYLSDGIADDLITELSRLSSLVVMARNSSFSYKGQGATAQEIGQGLGVSYLLAGSVRRAGDRLRITAQLVDTGSGQQMWAERYDRNLADVFALQDEITRKIVAALKIQLIRDEDIGRMGLETGSFEAYAAFLQGREDYSTQTRAGLERAAAAYRKAIALDPGFGRPYGALAVTLAWEVLRGWSASPAEALERAQRLAEQAVAIAPESPQAFWALSWVYLQRRQYEQALAAAHESIRIAPSYADGYGLLALISNNLGNAREAMAYIEKAIALNPHYSWDYPYNLGRAHYQLGDFAEAIEYLRDAIERNEFNPFPRLYLIASYTRSDMTSEAEWEAMQLEVLTPGFTLSHIAQALPLENQAVRDQLLADLAAAGVPE